MQAVLIRLRSLVNSRVIAPFRALAAPAKAFVVRPDGKTRWWQFGAFLAVIALIVIGMIAGVVRSLTGADETAAPAATEKAQAMGEAKPGQFRGDEVLLNPTMDLDKFGRVPLVKTTDPGVLAEAYVRFAQTVDMSRDKPTAWIEADQAWKTDFVPAGFAGVVATPQEINAENAKFMQDWSRYSTVEPVLRAFTTAVFIDGEIGAAPAPEGIAGRPTVVQSIPADSAVHVVRVSWIASMTPTKNLTRIEAQDGEGVTELLVACPGAEGFTEDSCKVVDSTDQPSSFFSLRVQQWSGNE